MWNILPDIIRIFNILQCIENDYSHIEMNSYYIQVLLSKWMNLIQFQMVCRYFCLNWQFLSSTMLLTCNTLYHYLTENPSHPGVGQTQRLPILASQSKSFVLSAFMFDRLALRIWTVKGFYMKAYFLKCIFMTNGKYYNFHQKDCYIWNMMFYHPY